MKSETASRPFSLAWGERLGERLNGRADFRSAAKWFDGSILLAFGGQTLWLKIYAGRVIDVQDKPNPLGFTFALKAPEETWRTLLLKSRNELLAFTGSGQIVVEGNQLEFMRLTKTAVTLIEEMRTLARENDAEQQNNEKGKQ